MNANFLYRAQIRQGVKAAGANDCRCAFGSDARYTQQFFTGGSIDFNRAVSQMAFRPYLFGIFFKWEQTVTVIR